jgi:hypothetical protein
MYPIVHCTRGKGESLAMTSRFNALFFALGSALIFFATAQHVLATLGEQAKSVASDRKTLSAAQPSITVHNGYTVQETSSDSIVVREYVSPSGIVFGIAWKGLMHPDLVPLLGSYADEYEEAQRQTPRKPGRKHLHVETNRVIVEKWGHMRNLQGCAYVPALIPTGVSIDEIK